MITSQTSTVPYAGNGSATIFAYGFPLSDKTQIELVLTDPTGVTTLLTVDTDYTVNGVGNTDSSTWTVLYPVSGSPLPVGWTLTVTPNYPITQLVQYLNQGGMFPATVEGSLDRLTLICQQLEAQIARAILIPIGSTTSPTPAALLAAAASAVAAVNAIIANGGAVINAGTIGANLTGSAAPLTGITPLTLSNLLNLARVDVASAATTVIGAAASGYLRITGTTSITAFDTVAAGIQRTVLFGGALTLTYNATSLILPTGASIVTRAGDTATFASEGSGNWRCLDYTLASGGALVAPLPGASVIVKLTSSGTWTCPTGITKAKVIVVGAGGGMQAASASQVTSGGGGGGTGIKLFTNLVPGTAYTVTIGAGVAGGNGGVSSFAGPGLTVSGQGGLAGSASGTSSAGTIQTSTGNNGDINVLGTGGGSSFYSSSTVNLQGAGGGNAVFPSTGTGIAGSGSNGGNGVGSVGGYNGTSAGAGNAGIVIIEY